MKKKLIIVFGFLAIACVAMAATYFQKVEPNNMLFKGKVDVDGAATFASTVGITGTTTQGPLVLTASAVALTSPTVTFSAANKGLITLTSDANLTGIYPTGGTLNQVITIISGTGSNTMRLDDGTSMSIGANVTLTEAQNDAITLLCNEADGDGWLAVSAHDN